MIEPIERYLNIPNKFWTNLLYFDLGHAVPKPMAVQTD
jgi:hypothetical protein